MRNEAEKLMQGSAHEDYFYIVHDTFVLMTAKETTNWMRQNSYLPIWLLPLNRLQDGTPYAGGPFGNSPELMHLDHSLNRDILHSFYMHSVLRCYIFYGEETDKEERDMCFGYSTPRDCDWWLKCIWDSQMGGTPSSARGIQDVDMALKALEIFYHTNGAAVEGLDDKNGHRRKEAGKRKCFIWGGVRTKDKGHECKLTKNMFFHNDFL